MQNFFLWKKLILPFSFLMASLNAVSAFLVKFSHHIVLPEPLNFPMLELVTIPILATVIFFTRNYPFYKIFRVFLIALALFVLFGNVGIKHFPAFYKFISSHIGPKILGVLGWIYLNQTVNYAIGIRYYFLITFLAILIDIALNFLPQLLDLFHLTPTRADEWLLITFIVLIITFCVEMWAQKATSPPIEHEKIFQPAKLSPLFFVLIVGILFGSLKIVKIVDASIAKEVFQSMGSSKYIAYFAMHMLLIGIGTIAFSVFSVWIGPGVLRQKWGWEIGMLIAYGKIIAFQIVLFYFNFPSIYTANQIVFQGATMAWIFILLQLLFLKFPKKDRYWMQGIAFLVIIPLLTNLFQLEHVSAKTAHGITFSIFGLVTILTIILSKKIKLYPVEAS